MIEQRTRRIIKPVLFLFSIELEQFYLIGLFDKAWLLRVVIIAEDMIDLLAVDLLLGRVLLFLGFAVGFLFLFLVGLVVAGFELLLLLALGLFWQGAFGLGQFFKSLVGD
jgi:hypothetical protein